MSGHLHIAICDDDPRIGETVRVYLDAPECTLTVFADPCQCHPALAKQPVDILITDLDMPGMDGITLMKRVKADSPGTDIIVITGNADKTVAIQALRMGAFDFFEKPVNRDELLATVHRTVNYRRLADERDRLAAQVNFLSRQEAKQWGLDNFIGTAPPLLDVLRQIKLLRRSSNTSVLVLGESGTGKELVAHAVHASGPRAGKPFVPVNCSAVPADSAESLLFGHTKGAFTGATADKRGAFDIANGGTLFLDEIGDMPLPIQAKLLRVLEDGKVTPVGAPEEHQVDVRVIAATNTGLEDKVAEKSFRGDSFYRLSAFTLPLPPLRERVEDIPALFLHFIERFAAEMGMPEPAVSEEALRDLKTHPFPGNVRELRNIAERAIILAENGTINPEHVRAPGMRTTEHSPQTAAPEVQRTTQAPAAIGQQPSKEALGDTVDLPLNLAETERILIDRALQKCNGNISQAARLLGINRTKLYRRINATSTAGDNGDEG